MAAMFSVRRGPAVLNAPSTCGAARRRAPCSQPQADVPSRRIDEDAILAGG